MRVSPALAAPLGVVDVVDSLAPTRRRAPEPGGDAAAVAEAPPARRRSRWTVFPMVTVVVALIVLGAVLRAWYLFHEPITSDGAVAGLMAQQILHGHLSAFYQGQSYGGGEPYLVAVFVGIFGSTFWALAAAPVLLSAVASVLTWRIARSVVGDRWVAPLAGAVVWAAPQAGVWFSTVEQGFRALTLVCGLAALLQSVRILRGHRSLRDLALVGAILGVGWWSSPEIVYYAAPSAALLAAAVVRRAPVRRAGMSGWVVEPATVALSFAVGALPWIYANAHSGWASLRASTFRQPPGAPGYLGRLGWFFKYMLPMLFNLRVEESGRWLFGDHKTFAVFIAVTALVVLALAGCIRASTEARALALGVVTFPFLIAVFPGSWFWADGRYAEFLFPLLVLAVLAGATELIDRARSPLRLRASTQPIARAGLSLAALALGCSTLADFQTFRPYVDASASLTHNWSIRAPFLKGWGDPEDPTLQAIQRLEAGGVRAGYADYWVAYVLDYLSGGRLEITTAGSDPDRWPAADHAAQAQARSAWIFVPLGGAGVGQFAKTAGIQGPAGISESTFVADLARMGVAYHVVPAGIAQAVVPARAVAPATVGITPSTG